MSILASFLLLPAAAAVLAHAVLTFAGRRRSFPPAAESPRVTVLIPAHDEEAGVAGTIQSVRSAEYPADRVRILVVADNCGDRTAAAARSAGADVIERSDPARSGKGYALAFGLPHALAGDPAAVLVLDADCELERGSLCALAAALSAGADAVQGSVSVRNPDAAPGCFAVAVGAALDNRAGVAKDRLGRHVPLRGTGMAFRADVLRRVPWEAFGLAEDAEFAGKLAAAGVRVRCEPALAVWSDAPTRATDLAAQRRRWRAALSLTRWAKSKPLVLALLLAATVAAVPSPAVLLAAAGVWLVAAAVLARGVADVGLTARRVAFLAAGPAVVGRLALVALGAAVRREQTWLRTRRPSELSAPPA